MTVAASAAGNAALADSNRTVAVQRAVLVGGDNPFTNYSYHTNEVSSFGNIVVTLPGTVLGGQVKLGGFLGRNDLWLNLKSNAVAVLDANQSGSATNELIIVGGTALWALKGTYALASIAAMWGQTTLKDSVDDCGYASPPHPTGCNHQRLNYNTSGLMGTVGARCGEEAAHANPALLRDLERGHVWLVDPLDGTGNLVTGEGHFAVMVALLVDGETMVRNIRPSRVWASRRMERKSPFPGRRRTQASASCVAPYFPGSCHRMCANGSSADERQ